MRNWLRAEGRLCGRPARSAKERRSGFVRVVRAWRELGRRRGWREVRKPLAGAVPLRLVQESLALAKRLDRAHAARHRRGVVVLARDAMWHLDATHLGRTDAAEVQGQVLRDAAVPGALAASAGGPVKAKDAIAIVRAAIAGSGAVPLVLSTDNGPPYAAKTFKRFLTAHHIVHLRNLPRTPQHNARVERTIRDVKSESGLGRGVRISSVTEVVLPLAAACQRLELKDTAVCAPPSCAYTAEQRERFHEAVCRRIQSALQRTPGARARRMAEREAIHAELEERGLIRRTRGGAPLAPSKAEINS